MWFVAFFKVYNCTYISPVFVVIFMFPPKPATAYPEYFTAAVEVFDYHPF